MNDIDFLIQSLVDIVKKQFQSRDVEYYITFICCSTNLSNAGRQKVIAKHKSRSQKELHAKRKKESYATNGTCREKKKSDRAIIGTSHWILQKRKAFFSQS